MQNTIRFKDRNLLHYVVMLFIALVVFCPLTFGIFSLKNDALIYFLPWRYHISEIIQQGHFPFWSPYLYTGLPLHSDIQSGSWNPVVLAISFFTRYDMQVLQWELLLYIFFAGAGMYKLIKETGHTPPTAVSGAIAYMCCGFITDSGSFIPWITSAAWLPFVFTYFYRLLKKPSLPDSMKLSLSLFLLLSAGYPAFFIFAAYLLPSAFIYWMIINYQQKKIILQRLKYLLTSAFVFSLLALPLLISFADFLPYYQRGEGASLQQALTDPFSLFCSISYLLPSAPVKPHEWINTDLAMRNGYVGIFTLLFLFASLINRFSSLLKFIGCVTIFSFVFSLGNATPLREWCHRLLPFMDSFRHPAVIRIFTSLGIILMAAKAMDDFGAGRNTKKVKLAALFLSAFLLCCIIYFWLKYGFTLNFIHDGNDFKQLLDNLRFSDIAIIQGIIQLIFVCTFLFFIRKPKMVFLLMSANVIAFAFMALPFTFVSQTKTSVIDQHLTAIPKELQPPSLTAPIEANTHTNTTTDSDYGYSKFYADKITIQDNIISPTVNTDYHRFLNDSLLRIKFDKFPFAYISAGREYMDSTASLSLAKFSPSHFTFDAMLNTKGYLNIFQQYHHRWKVRVNGRTAAVEKANIAFMRIAIPAGKVRVELEYKPAAILLILMFLSALIFSALAIYILLHSIKFHRHS